MKDIYDMSDAEFLAELIKRQNPDSDITPEWLEANGFGYWLTELTEAEAKEKGAVAYLRRKNDFSNSPL